MEQRLENRWRESTEGPTPAHWCAPTPADEARNPGIDAITRCRELLGDEAAGLSDADVAAIQASADTMARVIIDLFLKKAA